MNTRLITIFTGVCLERKLILQALNIEIDMAPEVIKSENRGRQGAMDIWSLGCVILECVTGRRPWSQLDNEW